MILPQSPDDEESADDTPGPDLCTLFDDYWDALRRGSGSDLRQRLIDRDTTGDSIAKDLDFLNQLHQFRSVLLAGDDASQVSTTWFSEPSAMKARLRMRGTGAGDSPTGMEDQATVEQPRQIGKYPVLALLDSGGQAQVYRVFHPNLAKEFALKLARRPIAMEEQPGCDEMLHEGRLLGDCEHPNLVRVVDVDVHERRWFVVMEYVSGLTLAQFVARSRPTPRHAARLVIELAQAVAYLHTRGITHQDIKPQNVLVDDRGRPRLIDFGLAQLKHAWRDGSDDAIGGTIAYMSCEQAKGQADLIGPRTDVFGLGGLLYYLLTGRRLYLGSTPDSALRLARAAAYIPVRRLNPRVPRSLERICHKALAADPERRYPSAVELGRALKRSLERRWIGAAGVVALGSSIAAALFVLRPGTEPTASVPAPGPALASALVAPSPLKVLEFDVDHYRFKDGKPEWSFGPVDPFRHPILEGDRVTVTAKLNSPAHWYLILLYPDGKVRLCLADKDEDRSTLPKKEGDLPRKSTEIGSTTENGAYEWYVPLTEGAGMQAFVIVASRNPLPSFEDWKGKDDLGRLWKHVAEDDVQGVWEYRDGQTRPRSSASRGLREKGSNLRPEPFQEVCEYLKNLHEFEVVQAFGFPVGSKK